MNPSLRAAQSLRQRCRLLACFAIALTAVQPLKAALVVKQVSLDASPSAKGGLATTVATYRSPTVARFQHSGASFDVQLVDLEAETSTYLFVEKKLAVVLALGPPADYLLEEMKGKSLNVELRPTQRTKSFGTRTCREHSARVGFSIDKKVTVVTTAPGLPNQFDARLKPRWEWILEGQIWLAGPPEKIRDDMKFRSELESRQLSLDAPYSGADDWWLQGWASRRLRAAVVRRGDLCAETLTYTPPPEGMRMFMGLPMRTPEVWLPRSWTREVVTIEESEIGDDQFVVPPGYKVGPGTYTFR